MISLLVQCRFNDIQWPWDDKSAQEYLVDDLGTWFPNWKICCAKWSQHRCGGCSNISPTVPQDCASLVFQKDPSDKRIEQVMWANNLICILYICVYLCRYSSVNRIAYNWIRLSRTNEYGLLSSMIHDFRSMTQKLPWGTVKLQRSYCKKVCLRTKHLFVETVWWSGFSGVWFPSRNHRRARMNRRLLSEGAKDVTLTELPGKEILTDCHFFKDFFIIPIYIQE